MTHMCVVDDDPMLLAGMKRVLRRAAPSVNLTLCADAAEALSALHAQPMDLLISDLRMPRVDGLALMKAAELQFPRVARVIMTGDLDPHHSFEIQLVTHRVVAKPVDTAALVQLVCTLCEPSAVDNEWEAMRWANAAAQRLSEQGATSISIDVARNNPWLAVLLLQSSNGGYADCKQPVHVHAAIRALGPVRLSMMLDRLLAIVASGEQNQRQPVESVERTIEVSGLVALTRQIAEFVAPRYLGQNGNGHLSVADFVAIAESAALLRAAAPRGRSNDEANRDAVLHTAWDAARLGVPMAVVNAVRESVKEPAGSIVGVGSAVQSAFLSHANASIS